MTISSTKLPLLLSRWLYYVSSIFTILAYIMPRYQVILTFLGINRNPFIITLSNGLCFKVRTAMDIWVIKETCLDHDYEKYGVPLEAGWMVVDIGGGLGDFALYAANITKSDVHTYEPFPESRALLKENLTYNSTTNVHVFEEAVSNKVGALHLVTNTGVAVRHRTVEDITDANLTVPAITLTDVVQRTESQHIDFLKMDCEGAEYEILLHAEDHTLNAIQHICMEYHDNLTPYTHHDLVDHLTAKGFEVQAYRNPAHTYIGFIYANNKNLSS